MSWPDDTESLVRGSVYVVKYLVWWHCDGRRHYGRGIKPKRRGSREFFLGTAGRRNANPNHNWALRHFAAEAVQVVGGWRVARQLLRGAVPAARREFAADRGIRIRSLGNEEGSDDEPDDV